MRIGGIGGRLALLHDDRALDVEKAGDGRFAAEPDRVVERWDAFTQWAGGRSLDDAVPFSLAQVSPPVLRPAQVFGIGLNGPAALPAAGRNPGQHCRGHRFTDQPPGVRGRATGRALTGSRTSTVR